MVGIAPILFVFWKVLKHTKFVRSVDADLVWDRPIIDAYEASFTSPPVGFWREMLDLIMFKRGSNDERFIDVDSRSEMNDLNRRRDSIKV